MDNRVAAFYEGAPRWNAELARLREVVLATGLEEVYKWRAPVYLWEGKNIAVVGGFKAHCVPSFFKGALLKDPHGLLVPQGANTETSRSFQFTGVDAIKRHATVIEAFIREAIAIEREGWTVPTTPVDELPVPVELAQRLQADAAFRMAFESLTPGRRKAYYQHIAAAKQAKTRESRVEQIGPRVLAGKGLNDCICGMSKRMPACDGSHRELKAMR